MSRLKHLTRSWENSPPAKPFGIPTGVCLFRTPAPWSGPMPTIYVEMEARSDGFWACPVLAPA